MKLSLTRRQCISAEVAVLLIFQHQPHILEILGLAEKNSTFDRYRTEAMALSTISLLVKLALFWLIIFRSGDPLSDFGIKRPEWRRDGLVFALAAIGFLGAYENSFYRVFFGQSHGIFSDGYLAPLWLLGIHYAFVGMAEESFFRAYLIPRFEELFGKTWIAVPAQAIIFGLGHAYQGPRGMLEAGVMGLIAGVLFAKYRSLWPLMLVHAVGDFIIVSTR